MLLQSDHSSSCLHAHCSSGSLPSFTLTLIPTLIYSSVRKRLWSKTPKVSSSGGGGNAATRSAELHYCQGKGLSFTHSSVLGGGGNINNNNKKHCDLLLVSRSGFAVIFFSFSAPWGALQRSLWGSPHP